MKKQTKTLTVLLSSVALLGTLAACGGNKEDDAIEVVFWHTFGKTVQDSLAKKITAFEETVKTNENVNVKIIQKYVGGYSDVYNNVSKSFATGTTPTITVAYPDHVASYLDAEETKGQYVVQLDSYINDEAIGFGKEAAYGDTLGVEDFVQSYIEEGQNYAYEGTYSLPFMKSTEVMLYNVEMVKKTLKLYKPEMTAEADIDNYLSTLSWEELMRISAFVKENKASISNALEAAPVFYDSDGNCIITYMIQNNIGYSSIDDQGHGKIDFAEGEDRTKLVSLLKQLKRDYDNGLFCTKGTYGEYGSNTFVAMNTMFCVGSTGGAGYNFPDAKDLFTVGAVEVPIMNNHPSFVSQGVTLALLNNTKYSIEDNANMVKYGWKFMKYLTNTELNTEICIRGSEGYAPVRESCYQTDEFLDYMADEDNDYATVFDVMLNDIQGNYYNTPVFPGSTELRTAVGSMLTDVLMKIDASKMSDAQLETAIDGYVTAAVNQATLFIK